jgi:oligopeptidase B
MNRALIGAALMTMTVVAGTRTEELKTPVAKKVPKVHVLHGDQRVDDYFWLREKKNPDVAAYLEAENAYTAAIMKPTEALRKTLYDEMLGRIKQTDLSVPYRLGDYFYYTRTEEGKQYPIYCRKKGNLIAPEEITLDANEMAKGHKFFAVGAHNVSDDGNLLAFSTDTTGFREYTLQVKDLRTGQMLPDRIEKAGSITWAKDNRTLFYTVQDHAKRPHRLYRHVLGSTAADPLVYEEKDERFNVGAHRTRSRAYLLLDVSSHTTSEVRYLPADQPTGEWKLIDAREQDHEYGVEHHGNRFLIVTNDRGRNFRLVEAPVMNPTRANWTELVPHRPDVMLGSVIAFADHYVTTEREQALPHLRITDVKTGATHRLAFPEAVYSAFPARNPEFNTTVLRYSYESFTTPSSVFDYDMTSRERKLLKQTDVLGGYDPARYQAERVYATAADGLTVPISLVYRKGISRDGNNPMLLTGYGSYGSSSGASFNSNRISLLDRGVVFAVAHIRGGGDLGKAWHDDGRMFKKKNTFTDFIAAAEHLIKEQYASKARIVIEGGSAGGLLMGAVANLRPDLFKAVVSHVPFVDVINTMLDASLPLTVGEFEEWGNPAKKAEYDYMKTYCPYTNLAAKAYPAMLVTTSFNDSQVMYWEPAKYVAKLRTLKTDKNPLLLKTNMAAGHGGASGRYDRLHEIAFNYAFMLWQMGLAGSTTSS